MYRVPTENIFSYVLTQFVKNEKRIRKNLHKHWYIPSFRFKIKSFNNFVKRKWKKT